MVLRRIFGPTGDKVTRELRKLHNEDLYDVSPTKYYSSDQNGKNRMGGKCGTYGRQERFIQGSGGEI